MSKEAVFTINPEPELRADFMAEVTGEDRPDSHGNVWIGKYDMLRLRLICR